MRSMTIDCREEGREIVSLRPEMHNGQSTGWLDGITIFEGTPHRFQLWDTGKIVASGPVELIDPHWDNLVDCVLPAGQSLAVSPDEIQQLLINDWAAMSTRDGLCVICYGTGFVMGIGASCGCGP